jgi:hypothetical protein
VFAVPGTPRWRPAGPTGAGRPSGLPRPGGHNRSHLAMIVTPDRDPRPRTSRSRPPPVAMKPAPRRLWSVGYAWARSGCLQPPHTEPDDAVSAAETVSGRGLGQPRFWPAGRVFVGRGRAAGGEPRTYSGRGHGRCRRFGTPLAVTHAGVSRAGRCDRGYTRSTSAVHAGSMTGIRPEARDRCFRGSVKGALVAGTAAPSILSRIITRTGHGGHVKPPLSPPCRIRRGCRAVTRQAQASVVAASAHGSGCERIAAQGARTTPSSGGWPSGRTGRRRDATRHRAAGL